MAKSFDVAVIGAGVFGSWTALNLRKAGASVVLLDAYGPAHARASSGGESRIIRMGYGPDEIYTRWSMRALPLWQELFAEAGRPELFQRTGVLWIADERERASYARETVAALAKLRVPFEKLTVDDLRRRYPQISVDESSWGILESSSGVLMARRAVQTVVDQAQKIGVDYRIAAVSPPVSNPALRGKLGTVATASGDTVSAAHFIFACGPWLPKLFPALLGNRIFITRQEIIFFGIPPGDARFQPPAMPTWLFLRDEYYGMPDLEGRGFKVANDRHGAAADPDTQSRSRHRRSPRSRKTIRRAPFPCPQRRARRRNARLPVRKHVERRFSDRSASGLRKCLARGRWFRPRIQTWPVGR